MAQARKIDIVKLTIQNLLREVKDGRLFLAIKVVDTDEFFKKALAILEGGRFGVTVRRTNQSVILERKADAAI